MWRLTKERASRPLSHRMTGMMRWLSGVNGIQVVWGSQTGTAMMFARQLAQQASAKGINATAMSADEMTLKEKLDKDAVYVFVQATFGKGEPTDNAVKLFQELESQKGEKKEFKFTVFGLGQSQTYPERYQAAGKHLDKLLEAQGGERYFKRGEGDDNKDVESDFEEWMEELLEKLQKDLIVKVEPKKEEEVLVEKVSTGNVQLSYSTLEPIYKPREMFVPSQAVDIRNPYPAVIKSLKELHGPGATRSSKHIEIDAPETLLDYRTGDYLGVFPQNRPEIVESYLDYLKLDPDAIFTLNRITGEKRAPFLSPCTIRDYLTYYADLTGPLKKSSIQKLLLYSGDNTIIKDGVEEMVTHATFQNWVHESRRIFLDVLQRLPGLELSLEGLIDVVPFIQPRFYSISSSNLLHPKDIHLCVGLNRFVTSQGRTHWGVCSNYLCNLTPESRAPMFVKKSLFKLPKDISQPVIMIAVGTGIAPFRAFVQERAMSPNSENMLIYGCMREKQDFLYGDELRQVKNLELITAFSHDQEQLIFVQDRIRENGKLIWDWINNKNAWIYVCGHTAMSDGVMSALADIGMRYGNLNKAEVEEFLKTLKKLNHFQFDVFAS
jgi:NADPH-ferrihemoprotein reductase